MKEYRQCKRCVMDTTAKDIFFDKNGYCNYCNVFLKRLDSFNGSSSKQDDLNNLIDEIKQSGKNQQYDCIVGVSGGADSSYTLHLVKELGLKPLAVHMDNGWNSELAVNNIKNLVEKLKVDLYTHVIDWEEYKALMQAFFDADVIDIEILYDNAMLAVNYALAKKYGVKHILSGSNTVTEGMKMPSNWNWSKTDKSNIVNIGKINGVKIKTFPIIGTFERMYYKEIKKIQWIPFLDFFEYHKEKAMDYLVVHYDYKKYPYKHYESVFTRFYQGYILPEKFNVDKRKLHLSTLICSKQIQRKDTINI